MVTTTRQFYPSRDRYHYDFVECSSTAWATFVTDQDAQYFGVWTNPFIWRIITFAEGDETTQVYDSSESYNKGLQETIEWYKRLGYFKGIDAYPVDGEVAKALAQLGWASSICCYDQSGDPC